MESKKTLESFIAYCKANPTERFWQALRNWSSYNFIYVSNKRFDDEFGYLKDTFYFSGKD